MNKENYKLSIGEPWDFHGVDGKNLILGKIVKEINSKILIFESYREQNFKDVKGKYFLLKSRYYKEQLSKNNEYGGVVNGYLILYDFCNKSLEEIEQISKYVFIGGLYKV